MQNSIKIVARVPLVVVVARSADGGRKKICYKINYNFPVDEAFSLNALSRSFVFHDEA